MVRDWHTDISTDITCYPHVINISNWPVFFVGVEYELLTRSVQAVGVLDCLAESNCTPSGYGLVMWAIVWHIKHITVSEPKNIGSDH